LTRYPGYTEQRRWAEEQESEEPLDRFFLPDQAEDIAMVDSPQGWRMVVRKYKCQVVKKEWLQLTALFVPNVPLTELLPLITAEPYFGFDETYVRGQLEYHLVPEEDRANIIDLLHKVGIVVYRYADSQEYRCFMISLRGHINTPPVEVRQSGW
jgi:hypothetical protein